MLRRKSSKILGCSQGLLIVASAFLVVSLISISTLYAQSGKKETPLQLSLVKAYLYIASRTTWPEGAIKNNSFVFCINRSHELFDTFSTFLPTKEIHQQKVQLQFYNEFDAGDQQKCNLIALSSNEKGNEAVAGNVRDLPILTIAHEVDITGVGGIVFLSHDKKLEPPKINFQTLQTSGLKIDSGVLDISQRRWGKG